MPSLVESVSARRVALGLSLGAVVVTLYAVGYYRPPPAVLAATAALSVVLASFGVKPFGDTVAYHVLQAAAFALWGVTALVVGDSPVVAAAIGGVGVLGLIQYGRRARSDGIWAATA